MRNLPLYLKFVTATIIAIQSIGASFAGDQIWEDKPLEEREQHISQLYRKFREDFYKPEKSLNLRCAVQFVKHLTDNLQLFENKAQKDKNLHGQRLFLRAIIFDVIQNGTGVGGIDTSSLANPDETGELTEAILLTAFMDAKDKKDLGKKSREQVLDRLRKTASDKKEASSGGANTHQSIVRDLTIRSYELMEWAFDYPYSAEELINTAPLREDDWNKRGTTQIEFLIKPMKRVIERLNKPSCPINFGAHTDKLALLPILSFNNLNRLRAGLHEVSSAISQSQKVCNIWVPLEKMTEMQKSLALFHFAFSISPKDLFSLVEVEGISRPEKVAECLESLYKLNKEKFEFLKHPSVQNLFDKIDVSCKPTAFLLIYWMTPEQQKIFIEHTDTKNAPFSHLLEGDGSLSALFREMDPFYQFRSFLQFSGMSAYHLKLLEDLNSQGFFKITDDWGTKTDDGTLRNGWHLNSFLGTFSEMTENEVAFLRFLVNIKFFDDMDARQKKDSTFNLYRLEKGIENSARKGVGIEGLTRLRHVIGENGEFFKDTEPTQDKVATPQQRGEAFELLVGVIDYGSPGPMVFLEHQCQSKENIFKDMNREQKVKVLNTLRNWRRLNLEKLDWLK